jgi:hypothetical protein
MLLIRINLLQKRQYIHFALSVLLCFVSVSLSIMLQEKLNLKLLFFLLDLISFIFLLSFLSLKLQYFFYFRTQPTCDP